MKYPLLLMIIIPINYIMAITSEWDCVMHVDSVTGTYNESLCITGEVPCATLNMALRGLQNSTLIQVSSGNHTLNNTMENRISDKTSIAIIGSKENETVVNCEPSAGIYVYNCINVAIKHIIFNKCGYDTQESVHLFEKGGVSKLYSLQPVALGFSCLFCYAAFASTAVHNVTIRDSIGSGLVFYKVTNDVVISNILITGGTGTSSFDVGGGMVIVHGYYADEIAYYGAGYSIANTVISNNDYRSLTALDGIGAGLLVIQPPYSVYINSSVISNNTRGLHVRNNDINDSYCSYMAMNNTEISSNKYSSLFEIINYKVELFDTKINDKIIAIEYPLGNLLCYQQSKPFEIQVSCSGWQKSCQIPDVDLRYIDFYDLINHLYTNPGSCSSNPLFDYKGTCPVPYSIEGRSWDNEQYISSCWDNHDGVLCGQCIEGHSVAINSPYLSCVPCDGWHDVIKGWGLLIALEFIPVTVMVAVIALLNVNLNQGSLKAYIFYCQMLTIPFPSVSYPSWFVIGYNYNFRIISVFPFMTIWNLGFVSYSSCGQFHGADSCYAKMSIHVSPHTTPLGAISFWYLIAFYPFLLLFLIYYCVIAYDKGYRCVVCVIRPIHRLLARFWRMFDTHPSLPVTIASVYTLCFTQLAATSLKLLHGITFMNQTTSKDETVFFYDGSQPYFQGAHGAAATLALIVLIVFIIVPVIYLSVYPFKWFQSCLNRVKIRKDMLISVTDVFTAPYSNGTQNTWDYRYLASSHFALQLALMILYYIPLDYHYVILILQIVICFLFIIFLTVFRPYKRKIHTFVEIIIVLTLMGYSMSFGVLYILLIASSNYIPFLLYVMSFIVPLHSFIAFCYCCFVWFLRKCKHCCCNYYWFSNQYNAVHLRQSLAALHEDDQHHNIQDQRETDNLLPDRMVNPVSYGPAQ